MDFSRLLPGPLCTRLLADLGADVVRVEPPEGDYLRELVPGLYEFLNAGKRAIRVDLKHPDGKELVLDLVATADVVVEGFRPGVADRLGIGAAACKERRPDVIYCSISGFGEFGPRRDDPGHDIIYEAAGGAFATVLAAGDDPVVPHVPFADTLAGAMSALSVCAGLLERTARGSDGGARLDVSIHDCVSYISAASRWAVATSTGHPPAVEQMAHLSPGQGLYRTADGRHLALAAVEDKFWAALCRAIAREDLAEAPFDRHPGRMRARRHLAAEVGVALAKLSANEAIRRLQEADVPVELVATAGEVLGDRHLRERGLVVEDRGVTRLEPPVRYDGRRSWTGAEVPDPAASLASVLHDLGRPLADATTLARCGAVFLGGGDAADSSAGAADSAS